MKHLLLLLVFMSPLTYAQWEYELIEETCKLDSTDYSECLHLIRINEGLYSLRQLPYLLNWLEAEIVLKEWEEAQNIATRSSWILGRNDPNIGLWRELQEHLIFYPVTDCFEREGEHYNKQNPRCIELRYYIADSFIMALDIQQRIYRLTGSDEDRKGVAALSGAIASIVYGIDGPETIVTREFSTERNMTIQTKYQYRRYLSIQADAEQ